MPLLSTGRPLSSVATALTVYFLPAEVRKLLSSPKLTTRVGRNLDACEPPPHAETATATAHAAATTPNALKGWRSEKDVRETGRRDMETPDSDRTGHKSARITAFRKAAHVRT